MLVPKSLARRFIAAIKDAFWVREGVDKCHMISIENLPVAALILDGNLVVREANLIAELYLHRSVEEMLGISLARNIRPDVNALIEPLLDAGLQGATEKLLLSFHLEDGG